MIYFSPLGNRTIRQDWQFVYWKETCIGYYWSKSRRFLPTESHSHLPEMNDASVEDVKEKLQGILNA